MANHTIRVTSLAASQLASHRLSPRFFTFDGQDVTATVEVWTDVAATADETRFTRLPKQLAHVWAQLGTPQQRHVSRKAAALLA